MDRLLIIVTDRMYSAFDFILGSGIRDKDFSVSNQITLFWLDKLSGIVPNHLITADVDEYPAELRPYRDQLVGRSMLVNVRG